MSGQEGSPSGWPLPPRENQRDGYGIAIGRPPRPKSPLPGKEPDQQQSNKRFRWRPSPPRSPWQSVANVTGKVLIWVGLVILGFAGYQLWGTNLAEARAQDRLESEYADLLQAPTIQPGTTTDPAAPPTTTTLPLVLPGDAVARIEVPRVNLDKIVVSGVAVDDLKKGPGHYISTPLPGEPGNAAIAGHRTTYGAPFIDFDQMVIGDEIIVTTRAGRFVYVVDRENQIVSPSEVDVIAPTAENRLTLTTCHPRYSDAKRLIVTAVLQGVPVAPGSTVQQAPPGTEQDGLGGEGDPEPSSTVGTAPIVTVPGSVETSPVTTTPAFEESSEDAIAGDPTKRASSLAWAAAALAMWVLGWALGRFSHWAIGVGVAVVPFFASLWMLYVNLALWLPGNI